MKIFKSSIGKAISTGYLLFFVSNLIAIFLTPYILKYVSDVEFGLYILCTDLFTWLGFMQLGTSKVLGPTVAAELEKNNEVRISQLFNSSFLFQVVMSILIIPVFYLAVTYGQKGESVTIPNSSVLILIFSLASGIQILNSQLSEMLIAARKIHIDNSINIIFTLVRVFIIVIFIQRFKIEIVFIAYLTIAALTFMRSFFRVKKLYPNLKISVKYFSLKTFKELLSNGLYFTLGSIAGILILKFDSFFLGNQIGLELVSKFYITIKLILLGHKLIEQLFNNFRPYISRFHGQNNQKEIFNFFILSTKVCFVFSSIILSIVLFINKYFIGLWVGQEYYLGDEFTLYCVLFYFVYLQTLPSRIVLVSTLKNIRGLTIARIVEGIVRVCVIFLLFDIFGIKILPISSIVTTFFLHLLIILVLVTKAMKWDFSKVLKSNIGIFIIPPVLIIVSLIWSTQIAITLFIISSIYLLFQLILNKKEFIRILTIYK